MPSFDPEDMPAGDDELCGGDRQALARAHLLMDQVEALRATIETDEEE